MVTKSHAPPKRGIALDGREVDLLHYIYSRPDLKALRGSPSKVISAINDYHKQFNRLMTIGPLKGAFIKDLITARKPAVMIELGGYVGYSAILLGDAVRAAGGVQYLSIELNPEMAAVANQLVDLAGLREHVRVLVGAGNEVLGERMREWRELGAVDMVFIDHEKEEYLADLWLLEELGVMETGNPVVVTDNVIYPGAPEYMEWVQASPEQKREIVKRSDVGSLMPNTELVYETTVTGFATDFGSGKDGVAVTKVVGGQRMLN
ncbi:MAG: hypothetical protein Q9195_008082 [Heterodermia aff. obscurata]